MHMAVNKGRKRSFAARQQSVARYDDNATRPGNYFKLSTKAYPT